MFRYLKTGGAGRWEEEEKGTDYRELEKKNTDTSFDIFDRL